MGPAPCVCIAERACPSGFTQRLHNAEVREKGEVMNARRLRLLSIVALTLLLSMLAWAQLYTSTVTGLVTDPTGAVIPNTQVKLVDEQKGFSFTALSDATGRYLFRSVPPGSYKLSVQAQGFQPQEQAGNKGD